MAIIVTKPVGTATNLQAVLQAGGSLNPSTIYYYIVIGYNTKTFSATTNFTPFHSDISAEGSFTTTASDLSAHITWTNPAEHTSLTRYQILISETQGNYEGVGGYGTNREDIGNLMTDGAIGYTISAESTETEVFHSIQLKNAQTGNIGKELGIIKVELTSGSTDLEGVSAAIIAAGYSDYLVWDGYNFIFKGWFISTGSDSGSLTVYFKNIVFIKGGIYCGNPSYVISFGHWVSDEYGANYSLGCTIDIQNSRYPIKSYYDGTLKIYGSKVTAARSVVKDVSEAPLTQGYYHGGSQLYLSQKLEGVRDSILGLNIRTQTSTVKDLKVGQGNNFGNYPHIRMRWTSTASMPYMRGGTFYDCSFLQNAVLKCYGGASHASQGYYTNMYDTVFPAMDYGLIRQGNFYYAGVVAEALYSDYRTQINYSIKLRVLDQEGNVIEGATVSAVDKDDNPVTWIEDDGTFDRLVTGVTSTDDRTTDSDGVSDFYTESYAITHDPNNTTLGNSYEIIITDKFPLTVTVSKAGFKSEEMIINNFSSKFENDVYLLPPVYYHKAITGDIGSVNVSGDISDAEVNGQIDINEITGIIEEDTT